MTKRPTHSESGYPEQRPDGPGNPEAYLKQVTTYAPPPAKFDPLKASARELARYGFPRRPDPRTEPERAALWGKAYSRPIKPVQAAIEIDRVLLNSPRRRRVRVHDGRFAPGGWGGVIAQTSAFAFSPSEPASWVLMGFHNCTAGTKNHHMDISLPTITEIAGASKNLTISVAWQANNTVLVFWEGIR